MGSRELVDGKSASVVGEGSFSFFLLIVHVINETYLREQALRLIFGLSFSF